MARRPVNAELVLVNEGPFAWYTGALPGLIRGAIPPEQARVDLVALAARCGARFIDARVEGFADGVLRLAGGEPLAYDFLALSIGGAKIPGGVKPIPKLLARVEVLEKMDAPRVGIVGAGVAGVELALGLRQRLGAKATILVCGAQVLPGAPARARKIALRALQNSGINVVAVLPDALDDVVHAYTPEPEIVIDRTLLVRGERNIFAAGDCAKFTDPLPRSGAIAVREGKFLAENLRRRIDGRMLENFQTPQRVLAIMSLNERTAVAWYGGVTMAGILPMRLKMFLDRRWVR